ncbi:10041_t:CDS:2, partial [Paraglomus occultum]
FARDIFQAYSDLVKEDNGDSTRIRIKVEDVVDIAEEQEGVAYAR